MSVDVGKGVGVGHALGHLGPACRPGKVLPEKRILEGAVPLVSPARRWLLVGPRGHFDCAGSVATRDWGWTRHTMRCTAESCAVNHRMPEKANGFGELLNALSIKRV